MIEIKNEFLNKLKLVSLSYAVSQKNSKHYLIIELDVIDRANNKKFVEVADETEYKELINQVKNQLN
jgi:hypothetical protein